MKQITAEDVRLLQKETGDNETCQRCNGSGVEYYWDHGFAEHGIDAIEPIRCSDCEGFGYLMRNA